MRTACDLDQLSGLSAERYLREYYLEARPVMLLGVLPLAERCAFARDAPQMAQVVAQKLRCGRTAYPALTGQSACGLFSLLDLNTHPSCDNTERALPVCARKPTGGEAAVNTSLVFTALPTRLTEAATRCAGRASARACVELWWLAPFFFGRARLGRRASLPQREDAARAAPSCTRDGRRTSRKAAWRRRPSPRRAAVHRRHRGVDR